MARHPVPSAPDHEWSDHPAIGYSSLDDPVAIAMAERGQTAAIYAAAKAHEDAQLALPIEFESVTPSGSAPATAFGTTTSFEPVSEEPSQLTQYPLDLVPRWSSTPSRNVALEGIPILDDLPYLPSAQYQGLPSPTGWSGILAENQAIGPAGCSPCVGIALIPSSPSEPTYVLHVNESTWLHGALLGVGFLRYVPTYTQFMETARITWPRGYRAVLCGGEPAHAPTDTVDGTTKLNEVIQQLESYRVNIAAYVPASAFAVTSGGVLWWTESPEMYNLNYYP